MAANPKPEVSIIIVAYLSESELANCLQSIEMEASKLLPNQLEVVVVDHSPHDKKLESLKQQFPQIKYLWKPNYGFGAGNNAGAQLARGKYLFFLNPDTELITGTIKHLVEFLKLHPKAAVVAPTLYSPEGERHARQGSDSLTPLSLLAAHSIFHRIWPSNPIARRFWKQERDWSTPTKLAVVPGTALMIRSEVFSQLGGFDEQFFLYFEESDLCRRVQKLGWEVWQLPQAKLKHWWGSSTDLVSTDTIRTIYQQSRQYYLVKHFSPVSARLTEWLLRVRGWQLMLVLVLILLVVLQLIT